MNTYEDEIIKRTFGLMALGSDNAMKQLGGRYVFEYETYLDIFSELYNMSKGELKKKVCYVCGLPIAPGQKVNRDDFCNTSALISVGKNLKNAKFLKIFII